MNNAEEVFGQILSGVEKRGLGGSVHRLGGYSRLMVSKDMHDGRIFKADAEPYQQGIRVRGLVQQLLSTTNEQWLCRHSHDTYRHVNGQHIRAISLRTVGMSASHAWNPGINASTLRDLGYCDTEVAAIESHLLRNASYLSTEIHPPDHKEGMCVTDAFGTSVQVVLRLAVLQRERVVHTVPEAIEAFDAMLTEAMAVPALGGKQAD